MKVYIKSASEPTIHLSELFDRINSIIVVDNAETFSMTSINASTDIDESFLTDWELLDMSESELNNITDLNTLDQIRELIHKERLEYNFTEQQMKILEPFYGKKIKFDSSDVTYILELLRKGNPEIYIEPTKKNREFKRIFSMDSEFYHELINNLEAWYDCTTRSFTPDYAGNYLMIFKPKKDMIFFESVGREVSETLKDFEIYLKIDLSKSGLEDYDFQDDLDINIIVSLHESLNEKKRFSEHVKRRKNNDIYSTF